MTSPRKSALRVAGDSDTVSSDGGGLNAIRSQAGSPRRYVVWLTGKQQCQEECLGGTRRSSRISHHHTQIFLFVCYTKNRGKIGKWGACRTCLRNLDCRMRENRLIGEEVGVLVVVSISIRCFQEGTESDSETGK